MKVEYIVVGFGLAGMAITKVLEDYGHSFVVLDNVSKTSSRVAAGVFNPVILKRFTPVWNADEQLKNLLPFYRDLHQKLEKNYLTFFDTLKVFKSVEDQNNWFTACDKPLLEKHMHPKVLNHSIPGIKDYNGFGKVNGTGRVFVSAVLDDYIVYLKQQSRYLKTSFSHEDIKIEKNTVAYQNITAQKIVFAEGYGLKKNPFFNKLPLVGAKGEMLFIKAPSLKLTQQIKSSLFVFSVGNDLFWVGATFNNTDKTSTPTEKARQELIKKLNTIVDVPYEIVNQFAGIRPTVIDRKPLVGKHPKHPNLAILNGLGTRGVMIAPTVAKQLYEHLEHNKPLPKEIDIDRFTKSYP